MRLQLTRDFHIPAGAMKVAHKASSAVAYLYTTSTGKPGALVFHGKSQKPAWRYYFKDAATREQRIGEFFKNVAGWEARKAEQAAERKAKLAGGHKLEVGHILKSSWGYEQTNICYYQVIRLIGRRMVELREIGQVRDEGPHYMTGTCTPRLDNFIGEPFRRQVNIDGCGVKVESYEYASLWDGKVGHWTAYH